jgi:hypothetical protein
MIARVSRVDGELRHVGSQNVFGIDAAYHFGFFRPFAVFGEEFLRIICQTYRKRCTPEFAFAAHFFYFCCEF